MLLAEEAALMMRVGMYSTTLLMLAQDVSVEDLKVVARISSEMRELAKEDPGYFSERDLDLIEHLPAIIRLLRAIKNDEPSLTAGWNPQPLVGGLGGFPR